MRVAINKVVETFTYGEHEVTLETGRIARQADGAVLITMGGTVVLVTVVGVKNSTVARDFMPLTVNYQEKTYAAGKIPGGYFKREGRPSEKETLTSRLIDRPMRPLFPEGFTSEVQIVATVMSMDPAVSTEVPSIIGAAAAMAISGIPFEGPLAAARVGYRDGQYLLNPSKALIEHSQLDLMVAGTKKAVLMVESEAKELSEEVMLGAVVFGHEQMQVAIDAIIRFAEKGGKTRWNWEKPAEDTALIERVTQLAASDIHAAYQIREKLVRQERLAAVRAKLLETLCQAEAASPVDSQLVTRIFHDLESRLVRETILNGEPRIDGRDTETVRPISIETGVLPRTHGSALFTRGETQAIVVLTLGTERDGQIIDDLEGEYRDTFMLHYNFPPYSVGEVGMVGSPKRREIGHGRLAKRAMVAVLPTLDQFPYVLRVVSEITESNGSSSMASVCGTSLALMDAGVPIKAPVAGIAMGLIKEGNKFAVLTDILGDEDHLGDMDFKVAGSANGVTALQMDIKIDGITKQIMHAALEQAKTGRLHILGLMNEALNQSRTEVSEFAPRILTFRIKPDKIRDVIGKGGAVIRELTEQTRSTVDITDDGIVKVAAVNAADGEEAKRRILALTEEVEIGKVYEGPIVKLMDFGAFVAILPGQQGLVHVSQICEARVENINDYLKEGQVVQVKVMDIDRQGRVKLTMKEVDQTTSS